MYKTDKLYVELICYLFLPISKKAYTWKEINGPGSPNFQSGMLHSPFCESTINCSKNGRLAFKWGQSPKWETLQLECMNGYNSEAIDKYLECRHF